MAPASTNSALPPGDHKYLADAYRKATFDLLYAARRMRESAEGLAQTRVKVPAAALADLAEAVSILDTAAGALAEARDVIAKTPAAQGTAPKERAMNP